MTRAYDDRADRGAPPLRRVEPWQTRSALRGVNGVPWWGAVLLALVLTAIGVLVDMERINRLGIVFQACYFVGCVAAVVWVQRRGLFGPMVQPPILLGVAVPAVVLLSGGSGGGGGLTAKALEVGTPLINGFPTMAITTGVTLLIGLVRLLRERAPQQRSPRPGRVSASRAGDPGRRR